MLTLDVVATSKDLRSTETRIVPPTVDHGADVWRVARASDELDLNSSYMYLLLVRDFADTCRVALKNDEVVAFLLGYRRAEDPETLFVWQVAVGDEHRGEGLAGQLVDDVVAAGVDDDEQPIRYVETTVTDGNTASRRLFSSFARRWDAQLETTMLFDADQFPDEHDPERLHTIGPISTP